MSGRASMLVMCWRSSSSAVATARPSGRRALRPARRRSTRTTRTMMPRLRFASPTSSAAASGSRRRPRASVDVGVELPGRGAPERRSHRAPRAALSRPRPRGPQARRRLGPGRRGARHRRERDPGALRADGRLRRHRRSTATSRPARRSAATTPAFIVADLSTVWVDVHVYQAALARAADRAAGARSTASQRRTRGRRAGLVHRARRRPGDADRERARRAANADGRVAAGPVRHGDGPEPDPTPRSSSRGRRVQTFEGEHGRVRRGRTIASCPRRSTLGRTGRTRAEITSGLAPGRSLRRRRVLPGQGRARQGRGRARRTESASHARAHPRASRSDHRGARRAGGAGRRRCSALASLARPPDRRGAGHHQPPGADQCDGAGARARSRSRSR